jgi:hypothetical protein
LRLLSKVENEYVKATVKIWWAILVTVVLAGIGVLEKWFAIGIEIPRWALASLAFLALTLAQFEAYKKLWMTKTGEIRQKETEIQGLRTQVEKKSSEAEERLKELRKSSEAEKELQQLKDRISKVPLSLRAEVDTSGNLIPTYTTWETFGGGQNRQVIHAPRVTLMVWKKPQSQDLEVTIAEYSLDYLRSPGRPPTIPVRRLIRDSEQVDITERLVRFIGGDPFNRERLLRFEEDIVAVLRYEVPCGQGEAVTSFRVKGKLNANTLQLEIEHLPNPPSSTSGQ